MNSGGTRSQEGIESLKHWRWLKECDFKNKHSSCFELFRRSLYISTVTCTWTPWGKKAKRRIKLCRGEELKLTSVEPPSTRSGRRQAGQGVSQALEPAQLDLRLCARARRRRTRVLIPRTR